VYKCWKQEKNNWKCLGSSSQDFAQSGSTGLSGGAPDSVRCARLARANSLLSGFHQRCTAIIHRTVRCAPDCPVSQRSAGPTVGCAICARHVDRANGREGAPDCPVCTGQCPVRQRFPGANGRLRQIRKEIRTGQCPVRQATEGKISLPGMFSTAPSCLGAIKGTPRRMENIKHTQSIPKHQDFDSTHLFLRDSI
jgi:hypothetical protein